ncbi:MAG: hypothetical protein ABW208_24685 [Pyrinomonadaceae bacterium]
MREQITGRLEELQAEFEVGQKMLAELEVRQSNLKTSLLRISGAIQILEELLRPEGAGSELEGAAQGGAAARAEAFGSTAP